MSDFIIVLAFTFLVAVFSLTVFAVCVKQVPTSSNFGISEAYTEVNTLRRRAAVLWRKSKFGAVLMILATMWVAYMNLKRRNPLGFVDIAIVKLLVLLLIAMASVDVWDVVLEVFNWVKTNFLSKK